MSFLPLTIVNFQMAGGWRSNGPIVLVYPVVVTVLASLFYANTPVQEHVEISRNFMWIVGFAQGIFLLIVVPMAIRKAVLRDFQSGMIEANRLTPLSGLDLAVGYLVGPAAQGLLLSAVGTALGAYFALDSGRGVGLPVPFVAGWLFAQFCLSSVALLVTSLVLLTALATRGKTNLMGLLIVLAVFGGPFLIRLVPGVALLMGVMTGGQVLSWVMTMGPAASDPTVLGWALLFQVAFAAIFLRAASLKIRAPHRPVFTVRQALLLLLAAGATLLMGVHYYEDFNAVYTGDQVPLVAQWCGSVVTFMVVALFAVVSAAGIRRDRDRAAALTDQVPERGSWIDLLPVLVALLVLALLVVIGGRDARLSAMLRNPTVAAAVIAAIVISVWTDYVMVYIALARGINAFRALLVSWLLLKGIPLVIAGAFAFVSQIILEVEGAEVPAVTGLSPIGTLILVAQEALQLWPGVLVQAAIALVLTTVAFRQRAARRAGPQSV